MEGQVWVPWALSFWPRSAVEAEEKWLTLAGQLVLSEDGDLCLHELPGATGKAWDILGAVAESCPDPSIWVLLWYSCPHGPKEPLERGAMGLHSFHPDHSHISFGFGGVCHDRLSSGHSSGDISLSQGWLTEPGSTQRGTDFYTLKDDLQSAPPTREPREGLAPCSP